jgi:hypothetical protein
MRLGPVRLTRSDREVLTRMAEGWRPLKSQVPNAMSLEWRGLLRLDWGPAGTPDADRMCWYLTRRAREIIGA